MPFWLELSITIFGSVMASSGLWAFLSKLNERKDIKTRMLLGLGHDNIIYLCKFYLKRDYITVDEYENLHDYLYLPYKAMGGNGTAEKLMKEVDQLPTKPMKEL